MTIKWWWAGLVAIGSCCGLVRSEENQSAVERPDNPDVVVESLETVYRFENDGTGSMLVVARYRVASPVGRQMLGQVIVPYRSETQSVRFDYLRTVKKDGRVVEAQPEQAREVSSGEAGGATPRLSDGKVKVLTTPDLEVGDRVEWRIETRLDHPEVPGEFWAVHYPTAWFSQSEVVVLDIPAERAVVLRVGDGEHTSQTANGRTIHRWAMSHPGPPDKKQKDPQATFAVSSFQSWAELADWFRGLVSAPIKPVPEVEALARQLIAGKSTQLERAEAIYSYVARSIRYTALHFDGHGFRPHPVGDVLRNGFGDCKDKYALLHALLAVAEIPSVPVLLEAGHDLREPDVPLPLQFNHVIGAVTVDGKRVYLDATTSVAAFGVLVPTMRGRTALIVEDKGAQVVKLPEGSPLQQFARVSVVGEITATGSIQLDSRLELRGDLEMVYRLMFHETNQDVARTFADAMAKSQVSGAEIKSVTASDPADLGKPFVLEYRLAKDGFINPLAKEVEADLPRVLHRLTLTAMEQSSDGEGDDSGAEGLRSGLSSPIEFSETLELTLPPGFKLSLPLPVHVSNDAASYESEYRLDQGKLLAKRALKLNSDTGGDGRSAALNSLRKIVERDQGQVLRLTHTGSARNTALLDSLSADQLNAMGAKALEAGDKDAALAPLIKATEKDPKHAYAWNNLGRAYLALARYADAERALRRQLEINPFDEYAHNYLGDCYRRQKRYDEAIVAFRKQLEINPFDEWAYLGIGLTYREQNRFPDAVQAFEDGLRARKDDPMLHAELAKVLGAMGRTKEAMEHVEKLETLDAKSFTPEMRRMITEALAQSNAPVAPPLQHKVAATGKELDAILSGAKARASQIIAKLARATTPDRDFASLADLTRVATELDKVGQALVLKGQCGLARAALKAAFDITLDRDVALRLADLEDADGKQDPSLQYYAWASMGGKKAVTPSAHLLKVLTQGFPNSAARNQHLSTLVFRFVNERVVRGLAWPPGFAIKDSSDVVVRLLIDEKGAVIGVEPIRGVGTARDATVKAARKLSFPPLSFDGVGIRHSRTLWTRYNHNGTIEAMWGFGPDPVGECTYGLKGSKEGNKE